MQIINISIANRIACTAAGTSAVQHNTDYQVQFSFDAEWDAYPSKKAVFVWQENDSTVAEFINFTGTLVPMPKISGSSYILIGVTAGDMLTSTAAKIHCRGSILTAAGREE